MSMRKKPIRKEVTQAETPLNDPQREPEESEPKEQWGEAVWNQGIARLRKEIPEARRVSSEPYTHAPGRPRQGSEKTERT